MSDKQISLAEAIDTFIQTTNAADVDGTLALFTPDAVIDDPSVGDQFCGHEGIRDYLERFFVGYHTATRPLSIEMDGKNRARIRVDFIGDFGHEVGRLEVTIDELGKIQHVVADLE